MRMLLRCSGIVLVLAVMVTGGCSSRASMDAEKAMGGPYTTSADKSTSSSDIQNITPKPKIYPLEVSATIADTPNYVQVMVFYATDRAVKQGAEPDARYGTGRSNMTYGMCEVSIPRDHRMGHLESPSIFKLEFKEDPDKHVVLQGVYQQDKEEFFKEIKVSVDKSVKKRAFIFIHGYNTSFADAARRTAQISYDLAFDGAAAFFSWPSYEDLASYPGDETNIEWAQADLAEFLKEFAANSGARDIYLIAHSMGNRALTKAFGQAVSKDSGLEGRFRELILTAPDIDAEVFIKDIAPMITGKGAGVTLYASSKDKALEASKKFHRHSRAGDSGESIVVVPGIDTVDATNVDTSLTGHSYFAENRSVLADIFTLVKDGARADSRFSLEEKESASGRYYSFRK